MPPRKSAPKPDVPNFPEAKSEFQFNQGFRYGLSDNPPLLGQKEIPEGKAGCLDGLAFCVTGTLPSIKRDTLKDILEKYGARLVGSISGKTDVVIRGCIEVGPKKLSDAKSRKLPIIDEDSLFEYLRSTNPNAKPAPPKRIEGGPELPESMFPISSLLTEKYRPRKLKDVIGNLGAIHNLIDFLSNYDSNNDDLKCAIVSGPPGIGKTTCAALCSLYCGYTPREYNASDSRSKVTMQGTMGELFTNKSLVKSDDSKSLDSNKKVCLIMDEIDGMSSGDRGGLAELVKFIKNATNPVICICNDRDNKKFTTLAKKSVDIKFVKPSKSEIAARLNEIIAKEKIDIKQESVDNIVESSDSDIRAALNMLQFWSSESTEINDGSIKDTSSKEILLNDPIDASMKLFKPATTIEERFDCYFVDYSLVPLYVFENITPKKVEKPEDFADALESIAIGDTFSNEIYGNSNFNLLVPYGLYSTVIPTVLAPGEEWGAMVKFPQYWGKLSRLTKHQRYIREMTTKLARTSNIPASDLYDSTLNVILEYAKLKLSGRKPSVDDFCDMLDALELTIDDYQHIGELLMYTTPAEIAKKMPGTTNSKASLTREYNSRHSNKSGAILTPTALREDYYISSWPSGVSKTSTTKKAKRAKAKKPIRITEDGIDGLDDLNESSLSSESEEETVITITKKKAARKPRRKATRADDDDDEVDDGFVVHSSDEEDDNFVEGKKRGRGSKSKTAKAQPTRRGRKKVNYKDDDEDDEDDMPNSDDENFIADDDEPEFFNDNDDEDELSESDESSESDDDEDAEIELEDDEEDEKKKVKREARKNKKPVITSKLLKKHKGKKSRKGL